MAERMKVQQKQTPHFTPSGRRAWPSVALVSAPFAPLEMPSLALGILKALGTELGAEVRVFYLGFSFAKLLGMPAYTKLAAGAPSTHDLAGEWIFAPLASADYNEAEAVDPYFREVIEGRHSDHRKVDPRTIDLIPATKESLLAARTIANTFVDAAARDVLSHEPDIVGFTSVFQQNMSSLAIARSIKRVRPDVFTVMGGANCEDPMGKALLRNYPALDSVVSGEGEEAFAELISAFHESRDFRPTRGLRLRSTSTDSTVTSHVQGPTTNLDSLPEPDYDEYFAAASAAPAEWSLNPRLVLETSRGCWWGEKHHCTFCGLNGLGLTFRRKSQTIALREIRSMLKKYPVERVAMVDNILDMNYFQEYLPQLANGDLNVELFYETKANLRNDQLQLLLAAGVTEIQPGVESFSDEVLKAMRKGVRAIQNVQLLKWCHELGITPEWNLLWGFPGESPSEYDKMARVLPVLFHLPPPTGGSSIRLDRYSPNYSSPSDFGLVNVTPYPAYKYVYGLEADELAEIAYYFTFRYADGRDVDSYTSGLAEALTTWRQVHRTSALVMVDKESCLLIWDTRGCARSPLTVLAGWKRSLYLACDSYASRKAIANTITAEYGDVGDEVINSILESLVARGLLYSDGRSYLALAVSISTYRPSAGTLSALMTCIRSAADDADGHDLRISINDYLLTEESVSSG